jgi:hypothetical protein
MNMWHRSRVAVAGEGHDLGCFGHCRWVRRVSGFDVRSECDDTSYELSESGSPSLGAVKLDCGRACSRCLGVAGSSERNGSQQCYL